MKKKPYPEFPLTAHPRGWWVKKINGKQHYFGKISEGWKPALERYKETVDDLQAGRTPRPATDSLTVEDLFNEYLAAAETRVEAGEMQHDSWLDSKRSLKLAARVLGKHYGGGNRGRAGKPEGTPRCGVCPARVHHQIPHTVG